MHEKLLPVFNIQKYYKRNPPASKQGQQQRYSQETDARTELHTIAYPISALNTHGKAVIEFKPSNVSQS